MTTARDIMHPGAECIDATATLVTAAKKMRDLHIGALPVCGPGGRLQGIITDRDIVVRCVAEERDAATTTAGETVRGTPVFVSADATEDELLRLMKAHRIRRVPVLESDNLIGIISEADLAAHLPDEKVARFVESICSSPPNL